MNTSGSPQVVCVTDYLDRPFEQVYALLESSGREPFSEVESTRANYLFGEVVRVSRSVARLSVRRVGISEDVAELRILAVRTGRNAVTELLLVAPAPSWMSRTDRVRNARATLEAVVRQIEHCEHPTFIDLREEAASTVESKASPLAS